MQYFYSNQLNKQIKNDLTQTQVEPQKIEKYLYISILSRILTSLEEEEKQEFINELLHSETNAQTWITQHPKLDSLIQEHLERIILTLNLS